MRAGFFKTLLVLLAALLLPAFAIPTAAQEDEEKSRFVRYVEDTISTPNFQIRLNGLEGTLSSNVTLQSITFADRKGVWLTIRDPQLVWNRSALLTGTVDIESLTATAIDYTRNPLPDDSAPDPEATPFSLPDLPVAIKVGTLQVNGVTFGKAVFGLAAVASVKGRILFEDATLDSTLDIQRLDGPGGSLSLKALYDRDQVLDLDLTLNEPENGIVANLLNIENRPPVQLAVKGKSPITNLDVTMALDVAEKRVLTGRLAADRQDDGSLITADLQGPLASILPKESRAFFGADSALTARVKRLDTGETLVEQVALQSGSLNLMASAKTLRDGFLSAVDVDFSLRPTNGGGDGAARIAVPGVSTPTTLTGARMVVNYDGEAHDKWNARVNASGLQQETFSLDNLKLTANGTITGALDAARRSITFAVDGGLSGLKTQDPDLANAVGETLTLQGTGRWSAQQPVQLNDFKLDGANGQISLDGEMSGTEFAGRIGALVPDLAPLSALAKRDLAGRMELSADGRATLSSGAFDLRFNGASRNLRLGEPALNRLLEPQTTLSGRALRDGKGLTFEGLRLANTHLEAVVDGFYTSQSADLTIDALLRDLAVVSDQGSGAIKGIVTLKGQTGPLALNASLAMDDGRLQERRVRGVALTFDGVTDRDSVSGDVTAKGTLDGKPVRVNGKLNAGTDEQSLRDFRATITDTRINGDITRAGTGLLDGDLTIASSDISDLAALALQTASGAVNGTVALSAQDGKQTAKADLDLRSLSYGGNSIGVATVDADVQDLFGQPLINADVNGKRITAGGAQIRVLDADVTSEGARTKFVVSADLVQNEARINTSGTALRSGARTQIDLDRLSLTSNLANARLSEPTRVELDGGAVRLSGATLLVNDGRIRVSGTAGDRLDLRIAVEALPLSIANTVRPDLQLGGTLSGTATVTGAASSPNIRFDARGSGLTATALQQADIAPLSGSASGTYARELVVLDRLEARNSQNISINARGRIPLSGNGLSVRAEGQAPLALVEPYLASRGTDISGSARFNAAIGGSLGNPQFNGLVSLQGASVSDPLSNLRLTNIDLLAGLQGDRLTISRGNAQLASGGSVSLSGGLGLGSTLPASLTITLNRARYTDGETFDTRASGTLRVTGALLRDPRLSGRLELEKTEITVPENFTQGSQLLEVKHVNAPAGVQRTLQRLAKATPSGGRPTSRPSVLQLDVTVDAPNQIFVRGRGLDAELGGSIRVLGPVTNLQPVGRFELRRGRLSILGQRIDLVEGTIRLTGSLDPFLSFRARTVSGDIEAFIIVQGRTSDMDISFTSNPELPQDEILAQIIFGQSISELSPTQIARLVSVASELTGGNSPGLVDSIRASTGLDDLDIVTDSDGGTSVKVGKYVKDNVYLGVQTGSKTEATINLDISDSITARGAVSSTGDTSVGIFLEKDY